MAIHELEHECSAEDFHVNGIMFFYLSPSDIRSTICMVRSFSNNAALLHHAISMQFFRSTSFITLSVVLLLTDNTFEAGRLVDRLHIE
jgi:hypothetical protein